MRRIERMIEIDAPTERVFELFSDFESWPRWMRHIKYAQRTGRRYMRWAADAPLGTTVEWESEITVFQPDQRIAWRSVRGDIETDGEVIFQETGRRATLLRIVLGYSPPGGRLGDAVARLFGTNPEQKLEEDLERFKRIAEGRDGDGRRSHRYAERDEERDYVARGRYEKREYDERARYGRREPFIGAGDYDEERAGRGSAHDERGSPRLGGSYAGMREQRDEEGERGGRDERRARDASSAARRSQSEGIRRYNEEREREARRLREDEEKRRYDDARRASSRSYREDYGEEMEGRPRVQPRSSGTYYYDGSGRGEADGLRRDEFEARRGESESRPRERDEPEYRPRYAMTPRERERERPERLRERGTEAKKMLQRRGVDRLLEDPPSKDWRRWEEE